MGSLVVGEDNMNAGFQMMEESTTQGWEFIHKHNQNADPTTMIVCFTKGTLVNTPKGLIKIEDIKVQDNVYSYNLVSDSIIVDTVANVLNRYTDHIYKIKVGSEIIEATSEHPFYVVGKEWVKAKDLKQGDKLKTSSKSTLTISEINYKEVEVMVYNIEVSKNKNYFVTKSKVLVHNKKIITRKPKNKK